jgi:tyrosinase
MKFLSLAFLAISTVAALPANQERQSGITITTGATGNVLVRKEVRQLKDQNYNQWVLFILAMHSMHGAAQSSPVGFYGIANVHGVPRDNYNNVAQCASCGGTDGYGTHNSVLFPPWHRVYVALFEQEMIKVAKTIANSYPVRMKTNTTLGH